MDEFDLLDELKELPRFRAVHCTKCDIDFQVHILQIYEKCPKCRTQYKCRAFGGIGTETQDFVDAVVEWLGISTDEIIQRHRSDLKAESGGG